MRIAFLAFMATVILASAAQAQAPGAARDCLAAARANGIDLPPQFDNVPYTHAEAGALCVDIGIELRTRRRGDAAARLVDGGLQMLRDSNDATALEENLRRAAPSERGTRRDAQREEAQRLRNALLAAADEADARAPPRSGGRSINGEERTVRVLFATTRQVRREGRRPEDYRSRRGNGLRYGQVEVRVPYTPQFDDLPRRYSPNRREPIVGRIEPFGDRDAFRRELVTLTDSARGRGEVLVFIHGYNTSFEGAARAAGNLASVLEIDGAPVVFSWPSRGSLLGYFGDEEQAELKANVDDLVQVLRDVVEQSRANRVYVVAHSMGNRLLVRTLEPIRSIRARRATQYDEIVFASPDVDTDDFGEFVAGARALAGRMTLYTSNDDRALFVSSILHFGRRAGQLDPPTLIAGLDTINTTASDGGSFGHADFVGPARDDLRGLLWLSQPPTQRCVLHREDREPAPLWSFTPGPPCETKPYRLALWYLRRYGSNPAAAAALASANPPDASRADYDAARAILEAMAAGSAPSP